MVICSNRELGEKREELIPFISNGDLLRYLTDPHEVSLFADLAGGSLTLLSLPVLLDGEFLFRKLILLEADGEAAIWLVYQEELQELLAGMSSRLLAEEGNRGRLRIYEGVLRVYLDVLEDLQEIYEGIEEHVLDRTEIEGHIVSLMRYDAVLQKLVPNIEGLGLLLEELPPSGMDEGNRKEGLRVSLVQARGRAGGLVQLGDNVSHAIDSINNYRLNRVMRTLTILTVCLAIPTLLAGVYGMNIPLPWQEKAWLMAAYWMASFFLIGGVLAVFRKRRYF